MKHMLNIIVLILLSNVSWASAINEELCSVYLSLSPGVDKIRVETSPTVFDAVEGSMTFFTAVVEGGVLRISASLRDTLPMTELLFLPDNAQLDQIPITPDFKVAEFGDSELFRAKKIRAGFAFDAMMEHFHKQGTHIQSIQGKWGTEYPVNTVMFWKARKRGLGEEASALATWTGKQASRYGYNKVRFEKITPGEIIVYFEKTATP